jgi:hypothetical protein
MSHPPSPDRLGIVAVDFCVLYRFALTFTDGIPMKILFAVGKTQSNTLDMAGKTDFTTPLDLFILMFAASYARKTHQ